MNSIKFYPGCLREAGYRWYSLEIARDRALKESYKLDQIRSLEFGEAYGLEAALSASGSTGKGS